ncbi:homoaconitate hydratase family protein [bacterium]|nr:homoaconitate hydratase family protein [bacterium]
MSMTITEKILAKHAGRNSVQPGENIWVDVDYLMTHDVCGPGTIAVFQKHFGQDAKVWDPDKVVIIPDHYIFTKDKHANRNVDILREFVTKQGIQHFYEPGTPNYKGVCHVALPEEGFNRPGLVLFGTDSHTCTGGAFGMFSTGIGNTDAGFIMGTGKTWVKVPPTMRFVFEGETPEYLMAKDLILHIIGEIGVDGATYRTMEFAGEAVYGLNMEERMTLCNMVIEAGGKNGVIEPDTVTEEFVKARSNAPYNIVRNDPGAKFYSEHVFNVKDIQPTVAKPHSPDKRSAVSDVKDVKLTRAYIGSCTGGKVSDFIAAAKILREKPCAIPTFIVPATTDVAKSLQTETLNGRSLEQIFKDAGCKIGPPSCAACLGGPEDTFGRLNGPEVCISTTNRNFPGRMGSKESQVFLASPYTVAASAIQGSIADPRDYLS